MAFEVIVRPVVFPNIRPAPPRVLPPEDKPDQGMAVIKGSSVTSIGASRNWSVSISRDKPHKEKARQFDEQRVYQVDEKGKVNKANYVDLENLKRLRVDTFEGAIKVLYAGQKVTLDNVVVQRADVTRKSD